MATKALEQNTRQIEFNDDIAIARPMCIKVFFDGGRRNSVASYGWVLYGAFRYEHDGSPAWVRVCAGSDVLGDVTSMQAELCGSIVAVEVAIAFASGTLSAEVIRSSCCRVVEAV